MKTDDRKNEDRDIAVPDDFRHGDHPRPSARVEFVETHRFNGGRTLGGVHATVVVKCPGCSWNARASKYKAAFPAEPHAFLRDTAVAALLVQALNNFRSKVPASCEEAMVAIVMTS